MILCMTFPLKSSSPNKLSNNVYELRKVELSQTNDLKMKEGATIKRPTFGDTDTVILSNSMDGNRLLKKTFYRSVQ